MDDALSNDAGSRTGQWTDRLLAVPDKLRGALAAGALAALLGVCWLLGFLGGGAAFVPQQWYYLPILFAAARFGYRTTAAAAIGATVLAGPLLPLDVRTGETQSARLWLLRGTLFLLLGLGGAALIARLRASLSREVQVAEQERALAVRKAAVIATVTHEFRTPLTVIQGVARTLDKQDLVAPEGRPLLEGLVSASQRLADLVDATLVAVEGADGMVSVAIEPVIVRDVVADVVGRLGVLRASESVSFAPEPDAEIVMANATTLGHVLRHLVENALKFSPQGSPITVTASLRGQTVEIAVRDHGPGIPDEFLAVAGDPFRQHDQSSTRERGGLGIGLFAATRLTEVLGGRLHLRRHPEGGTVAVVSLPGPPHLASR